MQTEIDFKELKEVQENEIEALKAIFMEDFHEVVNKTAWKVCRKRQEFVFSCQVQFSNPFLYL